MTQRHTDSPLGLQVPLEVTSLIPLPPGQKPYQAHPRLYAHDQMGKGARDLGSISPLEKEMATHSSTFTWKILWTEEPGRLQSTRGGGAWWAAGLEVAQSDTAEAT